MTDQVYYHPKRNQIIIRCNLCAEYDYGYFGYFQRKAFKGWIRIGKF